MGGWQGGGGVKVTGCCAIAKSAAIKNLKAGKRKHSCFEDDFAEGWTGSRVFVSHGGQIAAFSAAFTAPLPVSPLCTETLSFISKMLRSSCS